MHEHDEELEIYDNAFKDYFKIKAFDDYVFISLKLIACHICFKRSLLGFKICLSHAQIGLL